MSDYPSWVKHCKVPIVLSLLTKETTENSLNMDLLYLTHSFAHTNTNWFQKQFLDYEAIRVLSPSLLYPLLALIENNGGKKLMVSCVTMPPVGTLLAQRGGRGCRGSSYFITTTTTTNKSWGCDIFFWPFIADICKFSFQHSNIFNVNDYSMYRPKIQFLSNWFNR